MSKRKNKKVPHAEKLPSGRYRCRVYDNETKKQRSFIADTPEEAEIMAREWKLDHEIEQASPDTLGSYIDGYIALESNILSPSTIDGYKRIKNRIAPELLVLLAMWLSLRMSEIRGLKKSDFKNGKVTINRVIVTVKGEDGKMQDIEMARAEFVEVVVLDFMPYDHTFNGKSCHATGVEVLDKNGDWWYEYEDADGVLYYGR